MLNIVRILKAAEAAEDVEPELKALIEKYLANIKTPAKYVRGHRP
jgi:hypothetical protein